MMGRYDEAIQSLDHALELDPEYFPAFPMLMATYLEKNEIGHARQFYNKCVQNGIIVRPDIVEFFGGASARAGNR